jgi:hypothetical protein
MQNYSTDMYTDPLGRSDQNWRFEIPAGNMKSLFTFIVFRDIGGYVAFVINMTHPVALTLGYSWTNPGIHTPTKYTAKISVALGIVEVHAIDQKFDLDHRPIACPDSAKTCGKS